MKELTTEQKAKRYNEAIERARKIHNEIEFDYKRDMMEEIFPELKESDDERIRKAIISFLKRRMQMDSSIPAAIGSWIAWLEKQGKQETLCDKCRKEHPSHFCQDIAALGRCAVEHEQKPADKVEPKFKVGDKIIGTLSNTPYYITEVCDGYYRALEAYPPKYVEQERHSKRVQSEKVDTHQPMRTIYIKGYHQAEKDLELICEDIKTIDKLLNQYVDCSNPYQEVLNRFNKQRGK